MTSSLLRKPLSSFRYLCAFLCVTCFAESASASIVIHATRLVYPASEREITIKLENNGKQAALVQLWLDEGDTNKTASEINVPFIITPPVARIDAGKTQTLRLFNTGSPLEAEKELIYWFNVLEIPAESANVADNKLQLAFRTRIKLFFRPTGLKGSVESAPKNLDWRIENDKLIVNNNSDYHINFSSVKVNGTDNYIDFEDRLMLRPREVRSFKPIPKNLETNSQLEIKIINDYGGITDILSVVK